MTWCNDCNDVQTIVRNTSSPAAPTSTVSSNKSLGNVAERHNKPSLIQTCPSCGYHINLHEQAGIHDLPGLPAGVKFDPTDSELLEHLEGKVRGDARKLHPLIDEFIRTIDGENGICYTHPDKLPGVTKDGVVRHFFHRPSKAYTTGTRKRRKVHTDSDGGETRWHKTGKTRPVLTISDGPGGNAGKSVKGYKKILVLYTNYGKQKKPEKTNWVMHQYHLGNNEEEKEGELVVSKVFYQTQPRQCGMKESHHHHHHGHEIAASRLMMMNKGSNSEKINGNPIEFFNNQTSIISFDQGIGQSRGNSAQMIPHFGGSSYIP